MFSHTLTLSALLLSQICNTVAQLRQQNPKIKSIRQLTGKSDQCATEHPTVGDTFTSFLEVVYELTHEYEDPEMYDPEMYARLAGTSEFDGAVGALVPSYNDLIVDFDDPFRRRIDDVEIISLRSGGQELNRRRKLEGLNPLVRLLIEIFGSCFQCASNSNISDNVSDGRRLATSRGKKGSKRGSSIDEVSTSSSGSKSCGKGKGGKGKGECLRSGLPTEQEIQNAYDDELQRMHFDTIIGVQDLDEVEFCGKGKSGKKGGKSGKNNGGNRNGKKGGKKGIRGGTGNSKGGKKGSR